MANTTIAPNRNAVLEFKKLQMKISERALQSKSALARLMACENILVEHSSKAPNAHFDLTLRVLTLPMWKDMGENVYDALVTNQVGHAIHTPAKKFAAAIEAGIPQAYLQIVEDARVERMMKSKYPGLKATFSQAYRTLLKANSFGVGTDLSDPETTAHLKLIDRLNLIAKLGRQADINISMRDSVEYSFLRRLENLETFEDSMALATAIYDYCKQNVTKKMVRSDTSSFEHRGGGTGYVSEGSGVDPYVSSSKVAVNYNEEDAAHEAVEFSTDDDDIEPVTSKSMDEYLTTQVTAVEKDYYGNEKTGPVYCDLPPLNADFSDYIRPFERVLADLKEMLPTIDEKRWEAFKLSNLPHIATMVREFDTRKAADAHRRAMTAATGKLDTNKLHKYKFGEDIFLRNTRMAEAKNHGMVMFMDFSASMADSNSIEGTIHQVINMALFCRRVGIPFEVYAFTSHCNNYNERNEMVTKFFNKNKELFVPSQNMTVPEPFTLLQFFKDKMTASDFMDACKRLFHLSSYIGDSDASRSDRHIKRYNNVGHMYQLGGTPLDAALLAAPALVTQFKARNGIQIVNTIILSDGQSGCTTSTIETTTGTATTKVYTKDRIIRNRSTGTLIPTTDYANCGYGSSALTCAYTQAFRELTDSNIICYFIQGNGGQDGMERILGIKTNTESNKLWNKYQEDRYLLTPKLFGYSHYFLIASKGMELIEKDILWQMGRADWDEDSDVLGWALVQRTKKAAVQKLTTGRNATNAMIKHGEKKARQRVMLTRFIDIISQTYKGA
jgi:cobalamin biosynthesis protein CobT